jgi:coenzyme F420 biosynthesis associated uncharacterized protein
VDAWPSIDVATAKRAGAALLRPGPELSRAEASRVVGGLRDAAEASVAPVAAVTGLRSPTDAGPMLVVDRRTWLDANVEMAAAMLSDAAGAPLKPAGFKERVEAVGNGVQLGGALGALSGRVLGQFLPFGPPRLVLVAPNVAKTERQLGVEPADFRLWVCLHEQTHRLQFAAAPWLRGYLARQLGVLIETGGEKTPWRERRAPASLIDVVTTPGQRVVFDRLTGAMSLLEGYADVMMDRVGTEVVPSVATIRQRFDGQRQRTGWRRVVNRLMGMDLKLAQYRDGAAFCRAVIDRVGVAGLNAVYESSGMLPSLEEIHHPQTWLARAHPGAGFVDRVARPDAGDSQWPENR